MTTIVLPVFVAVSLSAILFATTYILPNARVIIHEDQSPTTAIEAAAEPTYFPCDDRGCCDEEPSFCKLTVLPFSDSCSYANVALRCTKTCGQCDLPEHVAPEVDCWDRFPTCERAAEQFGHQAFCELDDNRVNCRKTCATCDLKCEDSHNMKSMCERAAKDLRHCAKDRTKEWCPSTCGVCASRELVDVLARQSCEDEPECSMSDDEVVDDTMRMFHSCEDLPYSCDLTRRHPNTTSLCSDPTYRDTLCRATCKTCPEGTEPEPESVAKPVKPRLPARKKSTCSNVEARMCPRKCGVCTPNGKRSKWDVSNIDRLINMPKFGLRGS